ncbi:MAG TPA: peptidyl-prolyl cis-trans isomerase [Geopsychrobacteraceae bacterium]|nr:peptidyl-prolyl cis-trans isomerase [Geopsychrobacteraceae bacterium]
MIKKILLLILIAALLAACQQQEPSPPLVQIGAREITLDQFRVETGQSTEAVTQQSSAEQQQLQRRLLAQLIDRELILLEAEKRGMQISPKELETALADLRGSNTSEQFQEVLRSSGQNPEHWMQKLQLRLLTEKVAEQATLSAASVSDEEVTAYYRENLDQFRRPAQLRARQIMLATQEKAEQALARLEQGEDFADLAREVSLSPDRENGGDLGYVSRNQLPMEFDEALFKLPVGRVSDPVSSPYGYHLFLVEKKRKAGLEPLESVRQELTERLHRQRKEQAFKKWMQELRQKTPVRIDWTQLTPQK